MFLQRDDGLFFIYTQFFQFYCLHLYGYTSITAHKKGLNVMTERLNDMASPPFYDQRQDASFGSTVQVLAKHYPFDPLSPNGSFAILPITFLSQQQP
jgi:hypothetical protein